MRVTFSSAALTALDQINDWNVARYGEHHAAAYIAFLISKTDALATNHALGKPVPNFPQLKYLLIQKRRHHHAHVAVYRLTDHAIEVVNYYHTAQDWQARLSDGLE